MIDTQITGMRRRLFLQRAGAWGLLAALGPFAPAYARADAKSAAHRGHAAADATGERVLDLTIAPVPLQINGRVGTAVALNGTVPGPRFCRKFSLEVICSMIFPYDQRCCIRERDDGDQF